VQAIAADAASFQYLVRGAGHHEHLPKLWLPLNVTGLFQEIGPDSSRRLSKELRDVQDTELGTGPKPGRQLRSGDVELRTGGYTERL
jgi:hypothetical protein